MEFLSCKLKDYAQFVKLRLASIVVFSAFAGYMLAPGQADWHKLSILIISGFLVTCASNGFNQIIERGLDALMDRTAKRPLPDNRMSLMEAYTFATILGVAGLVLLFVFINPLSCFLGLLALLSYTLAYTPLKRITPFAVLVGAFPGAIPPLLGWAAATNSIGIGGLILFAIQFMWQFPHFWAIAWVLDDDYKKAGFKLLPSPGGRDKASAFQVLVYSIGLLPISLLPIVFKMSGTIAAVAIIITGVWFLVLSIKLYRSLELKDSRKLMLASFVYLPVVQIALILDKL
ncbi:MAG TPA: protoheme IX farnesyltransferase [Flavobacteriales bacterium]|nr:protoheme IX farnesyltransferase [Flavobacteriales bacterium]HIA12695.1 protoheme IX farnesyltransferase [Flavobacteriales bacterium]